jgi:transposase
MSVPNPECPGCRALQARVAQLEVQLAQLPAIEDELTHLRACVAQLQTLQAQLEARLNQNSQNSSRPPSSDPPNAPKHPAKPAPSGRKPGAQPGHKGTTRFLKPTHACHHLVPFFPTTCAHCHAPLPEEPSPEAPPPRRHQVLDLPPVLIETTEYQCHARYCPCCQQFTWAPLPPEVPTGIVGPRLQAVCALLVGRHRMTRRSLQEWLFEVGGEALSLGCLIDLEARSARALAEAYEQARQVVAAADVVNADETPWREGNQKAWLWSAATSSLALFRIDRHRSRAAFELLLPPREDGSRRTVICDRYSAYQHLQGDERQVCWAHLLREFTELSQMSGEAKGLGEALLAATGWLFEGWHAYRSGERDWAGLQAWMGRVQAQFAELLSLAKQSEHWRAGPLGRELGKQWECLWTFVRVAGVEPTNNAGERAVRAGVLWRKCSFGNQSEGGRAFVERILTVVGSLRLQGRGVLAYLEAAIRAAPVGGTPPSLVPEMAC